MLSRERDCNTAEQRDLTSTLSSFLAQRVRVEELQDNIVRKIDDVTQHNAAQSVVRADCTTSYTNSYLHKLT